MSDQHFEPGAPEFAQALDEKITNTQALIAQLVKSAQRKEVREYTVQTGGQTDATGFLLAKVELPQGFAFYIHRINLEAINPATGLSYTPAAPYTAGWVGFFRGDVGFGAMIDFAPPSPGSNVFPQISTDGNKQAAVMRGEKLVMQVTGGPVSTAVHAVIQGRLVTL